MGVSARTLVPPAASPARSQPTVMRTAPRSCARPPDYIGKITLLSCPPVMSEYV